MKEEYWKKQAREGQAKKAKQKELQEKYPLLGKKVRRKGLGNKWEEGVVVLETPTWYKNAKPEEFIKFSENDFEGLWGLPFQIWDEIKQCWKDYGK